MADRIPVPMPSDEDVKTFLALRTHKEKTDYIQDHPLLAKIFSTAHFNPDHVDHDK